MVLETFLTAHNSLCYCKKFIEEEIDIEALSLLSPIDLRSACGVPLGRGVKLINAAQHSRAEFLLPLDSNSARGACDRKILGSKRSTPMSDVDDSLDVFRDIPADTIDDMLAVPSERHESAASQIASATPKDLFDPEQLADKTVSKASSPPQDLSGMPHEPAEPCAGDEMTSKLHSQTSEDMRRASSGGSTRSASTKRTSSVFGSPAAHSSSVIKLLKSMWHTLHLLHPMDLIIAADHTESFKLSILFAKNGQELQEYITNMAQTWILIESLALGFIAQLWTMCPNEVGATEIIIFECLFNTTLCAIVFNLFEWAVFYVVLTTVDAKNMSAFAWAALGFLELAELGIMAAVYLWITSLCFVGYLRINAVAPGISWAKILWLAVWAIKFLSILVIINGLGWLAVYSGAMSKAPIADESFESSQEMQDSLFVTPWRVCRSRSSRASAVDYYFSASQKMSAGACEERKPQSPSRHPHCLLSSQRSREVGSTMERALSTGRLL